MPASTEITPLLAHYITQTPTRNLSEEVTEHGILHLIDTLAAIVSGSLLPAGRKITPLVCSWGGAEHASIAGCNSLVPPHAAALANGMMAHADETDDSHAPSLTHPGCSIVPAAFAMAEYQGRSGAELLRAVVAGYDIGTRMSRALGASAFADSYHMSSHAWAGAFGATAAAGALAGLDDAEAASALSYAVQGASGNRCWLRDPDHVQKAFVFGGMPARTGVEAALFASHGFTGVSDAIEGEPGLLAAFPNTANPDEAIEDLGTRFEIVRTSIKKWTVGSPLQAALDCIEEAVHVHGITEPQVESITVSLPVQRSRVAQSDMPDVNLPHALALYLVDGGVSFASLHDHDRMSDSRVREVAGRIRVVPRSGAARGEQAHFSLLTVDGRTLEMKPESVRGQPANPMSRQEVEDKALDLFGMTLGSHRAEELLDTLFDIHNVGDVRAIRHLWQVPRT